MLLPSLPDPVSFAISFTRLRTPSRLSTPISRTSFRTSERAVAAARCLLLKSRKNENIDEDDGALSGGSDWSEGDFDDVEETVEDGAKRENGKIDDGRTEVGKIMEISAIGRLGNKPPTSAYVKVNQIKIKTSKEYKSITTTPHNSINLSFFPSSFHSPLSGFGAPKPSAHSVLPSLSLLALYARLLLASS